MNISSLLIANRGEIAIRIARAATDLGLRTAAVYASDDGESLHTRVADAAHRLPGAGVNAYLDIDNILALANEAGCDAIHPGYGFLAERSDFARACSDAGLTFVGPSAQQLALFGDKAAARQAAVNADVPVNRGIDRAVTLEQARAFFTELGTGGAMIIKAVAGGGGRGTRAVHALEDIAPAFQRCQSEAKAAFGREDVYVEQLIPRARHVEVQILGDHTGNIAHLWERECSVQRRYQKVIEIAPAPSLDESLRSDIIGAAVRLAKSVGYANLGTFEFLVDVSGRAAATARQAPESTDGFAGARVDSSDPLALFTHDAEAKATQAANASAQGIALTRPDGSVGIVAPIQGTIVSIDVAMDDTVLRGQPLAVVEAMKMEHVIHAPAGGIVREVTMLAGDVVREGFPIVFIEEAPSDNGVAYRADGNEVDLDHIRPDLQENIDRHAYTLDENRPEAVAKRRALGYRMPRENIAQLVDPGSFEEYWPLIVAFQHQRYDITTLREKYPADGVVAGTASINGDLFDDEHSRAIIVHYDYSVLAGTQGRRNHYKQDRMFELANRFRQPLILFSEGGGGRPGDDNVGPRVAFDTHTFTTFSKLSGWVPMIGINNGRCFAGNTALLACCDVIIATESSTIAMGGPAMIEGGGLGIYTPEEVGPMSFQVANGVVDILVKDEEEAVDVAKKYLSYFQGAVEHWAEADDQRKLRHMVPENRVRLYDMREIIYTLADKDSVLEIREQFGIGVITCFIRIEGKPMGVIANNPHHLSGAIDSDGADKGARFLQLCDNFDIPVLSLMDCPGIMVGPDHERTALVRHCTRMFNAGANMTTPLFGVVVRKSYGLGVQAMCGASALVGFFTVAWPTAEFAGMNLEGSVKLGFRPVLASIEDPGERKAEFDRRVAEAYETARAVNAGTGGGLDDVIDPADTRRWIANSLRRLPPIPPRSGKKYPYIDPW